MNTATVTVNGVTVTSTGGNLSISNGCVTIDGKDVTPDAEEITISVIGDVAELAAWEIYGILAFDAGIAAEREETRRHSMPRPSSQAEPKD